MYKFFSLRTAEAATDSVPPVLERYELGKRIGRGGGGSVYMAYDTQLDRYVAIKVLTGMAAGSVIDEAVAHAAFEHPNIPRVYDSGVTLDTRNYISMELVEGDGVREYCRDAGNEVSLRRRVELLKEVCSAVHHVHSRDKEKAMGHRDIRAANVMVSCRDGSIKLVDFGLAARLDQAREGELTELRVSYDVGKAEWYRKGMDVDLYSIGILAWQLLVGVPDSANAHRLDRREPSEVQATHRLLLGLIESGGIDKEFASTLALTPRALHRKLKGDLRYILCKLIGCSESRYRSVAEVEADFGCYLDYRPLDSQPATWRVTCVRFVQRNPRLTFATFSLGSLLLVLGGFLAFARSELGSVVKRHDDLNDQLTKVMVGANVEYSGESSKRVPKSMLEILLASVGSISPSEKLSIPEVRRIAEQARSQSAAGFHAKAEETWGELYENLVAQHGTESLFVFPFRALFAAAKLQNGKGQEALNIAEQNKSFIRQLGLSRDDPVALYNTHLYAATQSFGGHYDVAMKIEEEVLRLYGDRKDEFWAEVSHGIAVICLRTRNYSRALQVLDEVDDVYRSLRGDDNARLFHVGTNRAFALSGLERSDNAIAEMRSIVESVDQVFPDGGPLLDESRINLAVLLARASQHREAKELLGTVSTETDSSAMRFRALVERAGIDILTGHNVSNAYQALKTLVPAIANEVRSDSPLIRTANGYLETAEQMLRE